MRREGEKLLFGGHLGKECTDVRLPLMCDLMLDPSMGGRLHFMKFETRQALFTYLPCASLYSVLTLFLSLET